MNSIGENCTELKKQYDACFNSWFAEKFLKGHTNDSACADLFKVYQQCVKDAIKQQQIELVEIDGDYLGSDKEYKIPPQNPKQSSSTSSTSDKSPPKNESTSQSANSKWNSANS